MKTHCCAFVAHFAMAIFHYVIAHHPVVFLLLIWPIVYLICSVVKTKPTSCQVWMPDHRIFDLMFEKHNIPIIYYARLQRFLNNELADDDEFMQLIDNDEQLQEFIMDIMACETRRIAMYMQQLTSEA